MVYSCSHPHGSGTILWSSTCAGEMSITSCLYIYVMRSCKMSLKPKLKIWFLVFWHCLLGYCLGFNLVKTPQKLGNCFQRYKQLKDWTNNKKQKKLSALFGCILKKKQTVFASSDSFCLITSHMIRGPCALSMCMQKVALHWHRTWLINFKSYSVATARTKQDYSYHCDADCILK